MCWVVLSCFLLPASFTLRTRPFRIKKHSTAAPAQIVNFQPKKRLPNLSQNPFRFLPFLIFFLQHDNPSQSLKTPSGLIAFLSTRIPTRYSDHTHSLYNFLETICSPSNSFKGTLIIRFDSIHLFSLNGIFTDMFLHSSPLRSVFKSRTPNSRRGDCDCK